MSVLKSSSADPREEMDADTLQDANQQILSPVAIPAGLSPGMKLGVLGIGLLAILTFTSLASSRNDATQIATKANAITTTAVVPPGGLVPQAMLRPGPPELPPPVLVRPPVNNPGGAALGIVGPVAVGPNRFQSPGIVVDATNGGAGLLPPTQGAIIAGVLETAINSDLPGYVRAIVSRDVMGFDGRRVLIPSGSRLIGQYRSGLAAGQSRAFIVWTRLTRPDGVTVSLGSPVTDPLGRAGLGGKVDSHFLKRFGSAIVLSVVQSGLGLLQQGSNDVIVRTADDAKSVAGIALQRDINIPPTVKIAQGTAIRIFIARDLDFSGTDGDGQ